MDKTFGKFAVKVSGAIGSVWAVSIALLAILGSGIYFGFSDKWGVHVGSAASVIALLSVFFLQRSQSHNDRATHLKLDELIKAIEGARNEVAAVEEAGEEALRKLKEDGMEDPVV